MEKYIYLLAKSYFIVFTIFFILNLIIYFDADNKKSRNNNKLKKIEKGTYHKISIRASFIWIIYYLSILIYFKI